ncbi:hypothetical protein PMNALOAF_2872 [Methylobacterium adhaesivum]|jgi:hypothetical protein|uniref:Uncharacterized protein n=1 Tax=Methylobacterium adhaesivum TaxID=333297 RepID=A0ABT8BB29_9HYPH|nr:hypothetical protein [Methylobacterium adhaesivum]MDN3589019.1 hypothetical protein [Methylobacterium adhaesivum]GJD31613.1 hypothetical protein PMNALOAF_2872 [Methylobacterium adhaesivum]
MTVLKLSSFPAVFRPVGFRTNIRLPTEFRLPAARRLATAKSSGKPVRAKAARDANVALIMAVMMSLVFAPVVGMHLFATFGAVEKAPKPAAEVVSQAVPALPPG